MKRMLILGIGAALLAVSASAVVVRVDQVAGYNSGDGEFNISPIVGSGYAAVDMYNNNLGNLGFGTFCIDRNTGLNPLPGNYNATVLAGDPNKGGQLIAQGTAWLFSIFANGGLGTASAIKRGAS